MPFTAYNFIQTKLKNKLSRKKIVIFGGTYRQGIGDTRNAPVKKLIKLLLNDSSKISLHDPYIEKSLEYPELNSLETINFKNFDIAIFCVPHKIYQKINFSTSLKKNNKIIFFDLFNVLTNSQLKTLNELKINTFILGSRN